MKARSFEIDPDIRAAHTPPAWVYTSPDVYAAAIERVFVPSWHFVADTNVVRIPGQVYPFALLEGVVDEPLLVTRDAADHVHCISNVCTHRGNLVCEHAGSERFLRCRYHGRRFALDGKFEHMPEFEQTANFPSRDDDLAAMPFAQWGNLLFAALRPHAAFERVFGPMISRVEWMPLKDFRFAASRSRDYLVRCNWALYVENYLEGFHIPFVHAGLADALDYGSYRTELFEFCSLQVGVSKGGDVCFDLPAGSADEGQQIAAYYFWVFPNVMFNFYPWGLSVNVVKPLAVDRTRVSFLTYVWDESKWDRGAGADLDRVEREDEAIVEAVQKGVRSRVYLKGRYSPTREQGTHHFHRLLAAFLK